MPGRVDTYEVAEDFLTRRRLRETDDQRRKGHSDRARRGDLCRWGLLISQVTGRRDEPWPTRLDLRESLSHVKLADLEDLEVLVRALDAARAPADEARNWQPLAAATVHRMIATLRGLLRHASRQGLITHDLSNEEELSIRKTRSSQVKSLSQDQLEQIRDAARSTPPPGTRIWWPVRDQLIVELLATCGLRASEIVAVRVGWITFDAERPLVRLVGAKGAKDREVPLPRRAQDLLARYLDQRRELARDADGFAVTPDSPLLVRTNAQPFNESVLDRVVRGLAKRAGVPLPEGAAAHAFRHRFGADMALRNVPLPLMQQVLGHESADTTAVYTRVSANDLIAALDDAGML